MTAPNSTLQIHLQPSPEPNLHIYALSGVIDVDALPALEGLHSAPANSRVVLDFALVQRVNSMGLAQLLKLFEQWQAKSITISVINANRMISMLFKMTGLTQFLPAGGSAPAASASVSTPPAPTASTSPAPLPVFTPMIRPAAPIEVASAPELRSGDVAEVGKLSLVVSMQSSQQLNGWYFFNTLLQRRLGRDIHLELVHGALGAERERPMASADVVFAKPFEGTKLLLEHNYRPVVRPTDQTDEVTILCRADDARRSLEEFGKCRVVTASPESFVYLLGRFLLDESGVDSSQMSFVFSGHEIKALQMLIKHEADVLLMLTETYRGLSGLSRRLLRELEASESNYAFHILCLSPQRADLHQAVTQLLINMNQDSQGLQVLNDLGIPGWSIPNQDEINMLMLLFNRYRNPTPAAQTHRI